MRSPVKCFPYKFLLLRDVLKSTTITKHNSSKSKLIQRIWVNIYVSIYDKVSWSDSVRLIIPIEKCRTDNNHKTTRRNRIYSVLWSCDKFAFQFWREKPVDTVEDNKRLNFCTLKGFKRKLQLLETLIRKTSMIWCLIYIKSVKIVWKKEEICSDLEHLKSVISVVKSSTIITFKGQTTSPAMQSPNFCKLRCITELLRSFVHAEWSTTTK